MEEQVKVTPKDRLAELDRILDDYEEKIGLPRFSSEFREKNDARKYLEMPRDAMERITPDECLMAADILISFSAHLSRSRNRDLARVKWADSQLSFIVTPRMGQYRVGSFNHNFDAAALDDDYTKRLMQIKSHAEMRATRLDSMYYSMKEKAEIYKELGRIKRHKANG